MSDSGSKMVSSIWSDRFVGLSETQHASSRNVIYYDEGNISSVRKWGVAVRRVSRRPDTTASPWRQMMNTDVTFSFSYCVHVHALSPWVGLSGTSVSGPPLYVHERPLHRPRAPSHLPFPWS